MPASGAGEGDAHEPVYFAMSSAFSEPEGPMREVRLWDVRVGDVVIMKEHLCRVTTARHTRTGKHGFSKSYLVGTDLLSFEEFTFVDRSCMKVPVPAAKVKGSYEFEREDLENLLMNNIRNDFCELEWQLLPLVRQWILKAKAAALPEELQFEVKEVLGQEVVSMISASAE